MRRWIPAAGGVFVLGFMVSFAVKCAGQPPALDQAIISDLLSPENNPHGYGFAAVALAVCSLLLLPVATLLQQGWAQPHRRWAMLGAWLYRIGLLAAVAVGATTPFQQPYVPVHVGLAFVAFMGLAAGLAVCLGVAACTARAARKWLAVLASLEAAALVFLTVLLFAPAGFLNFWFLALFEWGLCGLLAAGTVAAAGSVPPGNRG